MYAPVFDQTSELIRPRKRRRRRERRIGRRKRKRRKKKEDDEEKEMFCWNAVTSNPMSKPKEVPSPSEAVKKSVVDCLQSENFPEDLKGAGCTK